VLRVARAIDCPDARSAQEANHDETTLPAAFGDPGNK
jgi:hypothetical protein